MLPSLRLIAITFCCGFIVVFAGLRLATSVNGLHKAMPVMAAHAAPVTVGAIADRDLRRGQSAVPVMYDMRFAVGTAIPASAGSQPTIDRVPSVMMPLVILPPIALEAQRNAAPEPDNSVVAALAPEPTPNATPPVVIDIPLPEPAPIDLTFAPPAKPQENLKEKLKDNPAVAAAAPQAAPQAPSRVFDIPLPDPAPIDLTFPQPKPEAETQQEKRSETDASSKSSMADAPLVVAALSVEVLLGTVKLPTKRIPLPKPRGTVKTAALAQAPAVKTARAKPAPRRKAARTTQGNDFDNLFGFQTGKPF
jgi:hypothetical protein